ncbi:ribosome biogenesis GTP-binding protein YihA/YsxC [Marinospirillum sp. MEB164]|uniref:Probable GTP-binding protein EngB n=1 Tax=Marinospirillum alkalitolerans TaxID=3123374 RepID=A0ABW8PV96_9GAMM
MRRVKKKKATHPPIIYQPQGKPSADKQPQLYAQAQYLLSAPSLKECPEDTGWEVAFAGRSNAGKSSALNCLTSARLARTSKTPGRTQLINFFSLDEQRRLVDLPGYGYAKVPEAMRRQWGEQLGRYILERQALRGFVLLMDIRHPLTDYDWQLIQVAHQRDLCLLVLLTKSDKLKRGPAKNQLLAVQQQLEEEGIAAQVALFSSLKSEGCAPVWRWLDQQLEVGASVETETETLVEARPEYAPEDHDTADD